MYNVHIIEHLNWFILVQQRRPILSYFTKFTEVSQQHLLIISAVHDFFEPCITPASLTFLLFVIFLRTFYSKGWKAWWGLVAHLFLVFFTTLVSTTFTELIHVAIPRGKYFFVSRFNHNYHISLKSILQEFQGLCKNPFYFKFQIQNHLFLIILSQPWIRGILWWSYDDFMMILWRSYNHWSHFFIATLDKGDVCQPQHRGSKTLLCPQTETNQTKKKTKKGRKLCPLLKLKQGLVNLQRNQVSVYLLTSSSMRWFYHTLVDALHPLELLHVSLVYSLLIGLEWTMKKIPRVLSKPSYSVF